MGNESTEAVRFKVCTAVSIYDFLLRHRDFASLYISCNYPLMDMHLKDFKSSLFSGRRSGHTHHPEHGDFPFFARPGLVFNPRLNLSFDAVNNLLQEIEQDEETEGNEDWIISKYYHKEEIPLSFSEHALAYQCLIAESYYRDIWERYGDIDDAEFQEPVFENPIMGSQLELLDRIYPFLSFESFDDLYRNHRGILLFNTSIWENTMSLILNHATIATLLGGFSSTSDSSDEPDTIPR